MLAEHIKEWERELLSKGAAEGKAKGIASGLAQGKAEGMATGRAAMLRRQFTRRLGALPAGAERLIDGAMAEYFDALMDCLIDADTPGDVFPDLLRHETSV